MNTATFERYRSLFGDQICWDKLERADRTLQADKLGRVEQLDEFELHDTKLCLRVTDTYPLDEEDYMRSLGLFTTDFVTADARQRTISTEVSTKKPNGRIVYRRGDIVTLYGGFLFERKRFEEHVQKAYPPHRKTSVPGYNQYYVLKWKDWLQDGWFVHQCVAKPQSLEEAQAQQALPVKERRTYGIDFDFRCNADIPREWRQAVQRGGFGCMINHSAKKPNARFILLTSKNKKHFAMAVEAIRDIPTSTEILCDYGKAYFEA